MQEEATIKTSMICVYILSNKGYSFPFTHEWFSNRKLDDPKKHHEIDHTYRLSQKYTPVSKSPVYYKADLKISIFGKKIKVQVIIFQV